MSVEWDSKLNRQTHTHTQTAQGYAFLNLILAHRCLNKPQESQPIVIQLNRE